VDAGLYDVLLGRFADGLAVEAVGRGERRVQSVASHLRYLFNTRRGSLAHLPDYGLPDVAEVYRDAPDSIEPLRAAIKDVIERYEPRLRRVRVESREAEAHAMRLVFLISGELPGGERLRLETTFSSSDPAEVQPFRSA
jgi:type VI secretion system protein